MAINIDASEVAAEAIQDCMVVVTMVQHKWGTEKTDNQTTLEVKQAKGASGRAGKYKVNLANGFEAELRTLTRPMSRAYHYYLRAAMAWKDGERALANTLLVEFLGEMRTHLDALNDAKTVLRPKLPGLIQKAVTLNGALGNSADYPTPDEILASYSFSFDFEPVPDVAAFGNLPEGFKERFADGYTSRIKSRMEQGIEDIVVRLRKVVEDFATVLGKDKPKFFQSTLDNISQLTATLRGANMLINDDNVTSLCDQLELSVLYNADQLRDNMQARLASKASAEACLAIMDAVLGVAPAHSAAAAPAPAAAPAAAPAVDPDEVWDTEDGEPSEADIDRMLAQADALADEPSSLDELLGPEEEDLLGDLMPELSEPVSSLESGTVVEETPEQEAPEPPKSMIAEVADMDVDDEEDDDIASLFDL